MSIHNKREKIISALLIISTILPAVLLSTPKQAQAQWIVSDPGNTGVSTLNKIFSGITSGSTVVQTGQILKDALIELGKQLLKVAAKRLLAQMTQSTINWINSGFHGSPLFLENPDSFFKDIAKTEIKNLVDMIGYDNFRYPFGRQTALNVISSYQSQLAINAQYSLSKVINDPDLLVRYRNDFNYGGWNGFLINTQYPQNNYLGFNMIIQENIARQLEGALQSPAQKVQTALQQGMGFLSPQVCPSNSEYPPNTNPYNPPPFNAAEWERQTPYNPATGAEGSRLWEQAREAARAAHVAKHSCPGGLVSTTPGAVVANQIFSATNTPFLTTALDGALGNSIAAIFDALLNKLIGDGLTSLKSTVGKSPEPDNWSYEGNTLGGGYSGSGSIWDWNATTVGADALLVNSKNPQNIVVDLNDTTIATISGGTEPYSIQTKSIENVAISIVSSTGLIVTGVGKGETYVVIKDSSPSVKTIRVDIEVVGSDSLLFDPENVAVNIGEDASVKISGGTEPYFIQTIQNENVAKTNPEIGEIDGDTITVTGASAGQTLIVVKDSSIPMQIAGINITVTDPDNPAGTCVINGTINAGVTESDCIETGGIWSPSD